jgi:nucleoid-associated protein YgaU
VAVPTPGGHVVLRGDCLWHIAADSLVTQLARPPSDGEVVAGVRAWWAANADVIGPDPDLLLPGQVLRPPGP